MKTIRVNAEKELEKFIECIKKDHEPWHGWVATHLEVHTCRNGYDQNLLQHEIVEILKRHKVPENTAIYFIDKKNVYIFTHNMNEKLHAQAINSIALHMTERMNADVFPMTWPLFNEKNGPATHSSSSGDLIAMRKVLLVEDDPVTRWMVRIALKSECTLFTATNAGIAIDSYHKCRPDLVFLDIHLPDSDGMQVLEEILRNDPKANVVIFSSHDNVETMIAMLENGASGFVSKPFTKERLVTYLSKI